MIKAEQRYTAGALEYGYPYANGAVWWFDEAFIKDHSREFSAALCHDMPLINFQEWCNLSDIIGRPLSYKEYGKAADYLNADPDIDGEILSMTRKDKPKLEEALRWPNIGHTYDAVNDCTIYVEENVNPGTYLFGNIMDFVKDRSGSIFEAELWLNDLLDGSGLSQTEIKALAKRLYYPDDGGDESLFVE